MKTTALTAHEELVALVQVLGLTMRLNWKSFRFVNRSAWPITIHTPVGVRLIMRDDYENRLQNQPTSSFYFSSAENALEALRNFEVVDFTR